MINLECYVVGGFLTGSSALLYRTDPITSTGLKTYYHQTLYRKAVLKVMVKLQGVLILELEPTAYTHFLVHPFWDGVLLVQVAAFGIFIAFLKFFVVAKCSDTVQN